jgi:hypothetical protein
LVFALEMGPVFHQFKPWRMSDPAGFRGSIGVPLPRVDPKYDPGLTSGFTKPPKLFAECGWRSELRPPAHKLRICFSPSLSRPPLQRTPAATAITARHEARVRRARPDVTRHSDRFALAEKTSVSSPRLSAIASTSPLRIASGLLRQVAGVITDFRAGNAMLGCCGRPSHPTGLKLRAAPVSRRTWLVERRRAHSEGSPSLKGRAVP